MDNYPATRSDHIPHADPAHGTDPEAVKGNKTRALAGKALLGFIALMVALTWANTMLQEMTIATVTSAAVQRGALEKQITASGTLSAAVSVPVIAEESARVLAVYATAGKLVAAGDPLFRLDYTDVVKTKADAVESARTDVASKQRTLDWAAADLPQTTLTRLAERQASIAQYQAALTKAQAAYDEASAAGENSAAAYTAGRTLESAQYAYDTEKRRLDSDTTVRDYITKAEDLEKSKTTLADAEQAYADCLALLDDPDAQTPTLTLTAPVDGSVTSSGVSVGAMVSTSAAAMMLSDQSGGLELRVQVDEDSAAEMAVGDSATITVADQQFECQVQSLAAMTDKAGMYEAAFLLPGDAGSVGVSATMRLRKRTSNYDVIIPLSALRSDSDGDFVFVVEQSESSLGARMAVRRVDVYVLDEDSSRAALQGGISQRDTVVARGDRDISDGDRVRLAEE